MKYYVIVNMEVLDTTALNEYGTRMMALVALHGGKYLVRGGNAKKVDGNWEPRRMAVIEFPSREAHASATSSDEYGSLKILRSRAMRCDTIEVEGVD